MPGTIGEMTESEFETYMVAQIHGGPIGHALGSAIQANTGIMDTREGVLTTSNVSTAFDPAVIAASIARSPELYTQLQNVDGLQAWKVMIESGEIRAIEADTGHPVVIPQWVRDALHLPPGPLPPPGPGVPGDTVNWNAPTVPTPAPTPAPTPTAAP